VSTPEGKVKDKIKTLLKKHGAYWHMPVQNGMGKPALDFHVCHRGRYVSVEAKAPGKQPTPRQRQTIDEIIKAGGVVFIIDGDTTQLEQWLQGDGELGYGSNDRHRDLEYV
jgi:hypothetical protein